MKITRAEGTTDKISQIKSHLQFVLPLQLGLWPKWVLLLDRRVFIRAEWLAATTLMRHKVVVDGKSA